MITLSTHIYIHRLAYPAYLLPTLPTSYKLEHLRPFRLSRLVRHGAVPRLLGLAGGRQVGDCRSRAPSGGPGCAA